MNREVLLKSSQTGRKYGQIIRVIEDPIHGPQFYVKTFHDVWGDEFFWMKESEIRF